MLLPVAHCWLGKGSALRTCPQTHAICPTEEKRKRNHEGQIVKSASWVLCSLGHGVESRSRAETRDSARWACPRKTEFVMNCDLKTTLCPRPFLLEHEIPPN